MLHGGNGQSCGVNETQRQRAIEVGRKLLEREAKRFKVPLSQIVDQDLSRIAGEYGVATAADLLAKGANHYVSKPFKHEELHEAMLKVGLPGEPEVSGAAPGAAGPLANVWLRRSAHLSRGRCSNQTLSPAGGSSPPSNN